MKSKRENKGHIIDLWSLSKDNKLPCILCEDNEMTYTRTAIIKHLIKVHNWKPSDAKEAFKEIKVNDAEII